MMIRLIVVDGTAAQRLLYSAHLKHLGCEVTAVEDFKRTLARLENDSRFDAIFVSVTFPFEKDLDFIIQVKQHFPQLPVVVIAQLEANQFPMTRAMHQQADVLMSVPMCKADFEKVLKQLELA